MSLTRYRPQLGQAFSLPISQPAAFARLSAPWLALAIAMQFAGNLPVPGMDRLVLVLNALAVGGFGFAWQRFAAKAELLAPLQLVARLLLWALVYQILRIYEAFPEPIIAMAMGDSPNTQAMVMAGKQLFQLLIGGLFVILPLIALKKAGSGGPRLQEMVVAGGLAVGLCYVLANLPFTLATQVLVEAAPSLPSTDAVVAGFKVLQVLISFGATAVAAAYFAYVWQDLQANTPTQAVAEPAPVAAVKGKKTVKGKR